MHRCCKGWTCVLRSECLWRGDRCRSCLQLLLWQLLLWQLLLLLHLELLLWLLRLNLWLRKLLLTAGEIATADRSGHRNSTLHL